MTKRWLAGVALLSLLLLSGCVEGEHTYTVNPGGSGKLQVNVLVPMAAQPTFGPGPGGPGGKPPDDSLDGKKSQFVSRVLAEAKGVTAWKDVSAEFAPDGRIRFTGTAYFKNLEDVDLENLFSGKNKITRGDDGSLKLVPLENSPSLGGPAAPLPDPTKLNDKELDEQILKQRINYQSAKPMMTAFLADLKIKYVFHLPGEVGNARVYQPMGKQGVVLLVDGNAMLKTMKETMARDNDFFRKAVRDSKSLAVIDQNSPSIGGLNLNEAMVTVAKPAGPQFDYAKETQAARMAYPELRKKFALADEFPLPLKDEDARKKGAFPFPIDKPGTKPPPP